MFEGKILLYGNEQLCTQIAFVLEIKDYKIINKIKKKNSNEKIVICEDYKKIKSVIKQKNLKHKKDYYTIKDIYDFIDKNNKIQYIWYKHRKYLNVHNLKNIKNIIRKPTRKIDKIRSLSIEYLKPSEMMIMALTSPQKKIQCSNLEETCNIDSDGNLWGCCPGWIKIPFGNILKNKEPYNNYVSRIIKLSSINKTYCFCDFERCKYGIPKEAITKIKNIHCEKTPKELTISIDRSCNLKCPSCRRCINAKTNKKSYNIYEKLKETNWLNNSYIVLAGQGEAFLSPIYRKIMFEDIKSKRIHIFTNGTLFNEKNWEKIRKKYNEIKVSISVDAATEETYKKLRYGNFNYLMKNLKLLGAKRKDGEIKNLELNFVVQYDNFKEIHKFIQLGKTINADKINFTKLTDWGTFPKEEFNKKRMIIDDKYLNKELYTILKADIMKDKIVNIETFKEYIEKSKEIYEAK